MRNNRYWIGGCRWIFLVWTCSCSSNVEPGICISFDDRTIHEWEQLSGLFDRYNAKATFFITQIDSLSEEEVAILQKMKSRGHEIGSHGALHVLSEFYIQKHGYTDYLAKEIDRSIAGMDSVGLKPTAFAYPYGAPYWFTDYLILKRFEVIRKVAVKPETTPITDVDEIFSNGNDDIVMALGFDYISRLSREDIDDAIERVIEKKEVVSFYSHYPNKDSTDSYSFDSRLFEYMLKTAQAQGLRFYTVSELND
jgi:peptidoglycan/xylan/chitin deacetylase (PgdA/CDA1 family)